MTGGAASLGTSSIRGHGCILRIYYIIQDTECRLAAKTKSQITGFRLNVDMRLNLFADDTPLHTAKKPNTDSENQSDSLVWDGSWWFYRSGAAPLSMV